MVSQPNAMQTQNDILALRSVATIVLCNIRTERSYNHDKFHVVTSTMYGRSTVLYYYGVRDKYGGIFS